MTFDRRSISPAVWALVVALVLTPLAASAQTGSPVNTAGVSDRIEADTKLKKAKITRIGVSTPGPTFEYFVMTVVLRLYGASPTLGGGKAVNGKWNLTSRCFGNLGNIVMTDTEKISDGNAAYSGMIAGSGACNFVDFDSTFKGGATFGMPADARFVATTVPVYPGSACVPDLHTMCLGKEGRFKVEIDWRDGPGGSDPAVAFPQSSDSGLFYFFSPENWEMLVKVLDGCNINDRWWVFASAATDVGWELTVEDTASGEVWTGSNSLGQRSPAITDTAAFATCP